MTERLSGLSVKETSRDSLTHEIIGAAIVISKAFGPGLLESVYEACMVHELEKRHFHVLRQVPFPVVYDGIEMPLGFRLDLIVQGSVIVEIKTVKNLLPVHQAQLLTYMRLSGIGKGLLINFHAFPFSHGIKRLVL